MSPENELPGYETLREWQSLCKNGSSYRNPGFILSPAYNAYHKIHKVQVGEVGAIKLLSIADELADAWLPQYSEVAGSAYSEAALALRSLNTQDRLEIIEKSALCWERALATQEEINNTQNLAYLHELIAPYRQALSLAFIPMYRSIVSGNVTESVLRQTFLDVLAIAQLTGIRRHLANKDSSEQVASEMIGFEHECNALLALLYLKDPRHIPLPSSLRSGEGFYYPRQTHDIVVLNQHWGNILKITPVEVKAKASLSDLKRYKALIVRGKMHLSLPGRTTPEFTRESYRAMVEGNPTDRDELTVQTISDRIIILLQQYQRGHRIDLRKSDTRFHDVAMLAASHPEFSPNRAALTNHYKL